LPIKKPEISIVIPVYNEEAIVESALQDLVKKLTRLDISFEILVAENGSSDQTPTILATLSKMEKRIRFINLPLPNYGMAMKEGILQARGQFVICDEIDLGDIEFYQRALQILTPGDCQLVIGSKMLPGSRDCRPFRRHFATWTINTLLRIFLGFEGTDTHGLKAFNRRAILPVVNLCQVDKDLFASEMVIRSQKMEIPWREIPIKVEEKRPPSIDLLHRVPNVLHNLVKLIKIFR